MPHIPSHPKPGLGTLYEISTLTLTENGNLAVQKVNWAVLLGIWASLRPTHWQDQTQDVEREKQLKPTAYMGFCWVLKMESEVKTNLCTT